MSEEMTKREERKEEVKEAKKKQRKGKKLTRHEKKVIKKNAKREQRIMLGLLVVLIIAMLYFTDMFGLFDFPGNGFGEGYTSFSQADSTGGDKDSIDKVDSSVDISQNDKTEDAVVTPEVNQVEPEEVKEEITPSPTEKVEETVVPTEQPEDKTEIGVEAIEITIKVKVDDYTIDGKSYTLDEIESLLKDETKNYVVKTDTKLGRPESNNKLKELLAKYNK